MSHQDKATPPGGVVCLDDQRLIAQWVAAGNLNASVRRALWAAYSADERAVLRERFELELFGNVAEVR